MAVSLTALTSVFAAALAARRPKPSAVPPAGHADAMASAVERLVAQDKHRSLMAALDALHAQWKSDGRPHRFEV